VLLIATPGHTPGHTSMLLRHGGKQLLLAGDNGYARKSWRDGILPGLMKDPENMERSLKWEKDFHDGSDDLIDVISDHETELDKLVYEF
jgi:glyoxylase-like metal-dependent hydrolase (beta-lactamase superfamily II)